MCVQMHTLYIHILTCKLIIFRIFLLCGNNIEIGSIIVQICHYLKTDITVACQSRACYSMKSLGAKKVFQTESISIDQLLNKTPNG